MTPAIKLLEKAGIVHRVHEYDHDAACTDYGEEAASKLGVPLTQMYKTLVVKSDAGQLALVLVSVQDKVDLKKLAHALGSKKADLADPAFAEKTTGYVLGGISVLGGRKRLPVFIDTAMSTQQNIYISAGKRGLQLELAAADLIQVTQATLAPLAVSSSGE
jgi:Cys-tRNA(Pro)/Cys-tRNA(Cys) deacylase